MIYFSSKSKENHTIDYSTVNPHVNIFTELSLQYGKNRSQKVSCGKKS